MKLNVFQAPGLQHGFFETFLDDDDGCPDLFLPITRVTGVVTEKGSVDIRAPGIVLELEIDIPETTLMADGRQMVPGRGRGLNRVP